MIAVEVILRPPPSESISYTLPDNQEVHLDKDAYFLPEVMMTGTTGVVSHCPINSQDDGQALPDTIHDCIQKCDVEVILRAGIERRFGKS